MKEEKIFILLHLKEYNKMKEKKKEEKKIIIIKKKKNK